MSLAPEAQMRACLAVLYRAAVEARMLGYEGSQAGLSKEKSAQLADLMDAIHNIPDLAGRWEDCDESLVVGMLEGYDEKWSPLGGLSEVYRRARAESGSSK